MRILIHALAALENGGSDRYLRGMVSALGNVRPETKYLIYVNPTFHLMDVPQNAEVRSVNAMSVGRRLWWDQVALPRIVRQEKIDVIWATLYFGSMRPPVPQLMFQRNVMYYCDHYLHELNFRNSTIIGMRRWLLYRIMRSSFMIITPSAAMRDMILSKHPDIPVERFKILPHAFDLEPDTNHLPAAQMQMFASTDPHALKFLYVGHLMPFKGLFPLLDALAWVVAQTTRTVKLFLTIAREDWPDGFDRFTSKVSELKLDGHVRILGKLRGNEMGALYKSCDVLVYPSLCESFGFPLLEAMSMGLPIVASDTAVNRELAGNCALYFPSGNIEETAKTLLKIMNDAALRKSLGQRAQARFENNHLRWTEYVRRIIELSQRALSPSKI